MDRQSLVKKALVAVHAAGMVIRDIQSDVAGYAQMAGEDREAAMRDASPAKLKKLEYATFLSLFIEEIVDSCELGRGYILESMKTKGHTTYLGITLDTSVRPPVYRVATMIICKPASRSKIVYQNISETYVRTYDATVNFGDEVNRYIDSSKILDIDIVCSPRAQRGKGSASIMLAYVLAVQSTRKMNRQYKYQGVISFLAMNNDNTVPLAGIASRFNWRPLPVATELQREGGLDPIQIAGPDFTETFGRRWGSQIKFQVWEDLSPSWWEEADNVLPYDGLVELCPSKSREGRSLCK